ncbi:hypothetical protein TrRE_jg8844 [Triparma retinervis]|uniref:Uncharacterized protein n=1 Tax=Triparma retinervis TaxID=2557542 RepID=A0A9W7AC90_9STRA|nr:hypothetical protein TrRE_jg8844 [Triparma retinervis]
MAPIASILTYSVLNVSLATSDDPQPGGVCWKDSYGRGVGRAIHSCPSDQEKNGALCYPLCKENYYGVGPVCWENCEKGWVDEGALCRKDGSIETVAKKSYGRGAGYVLGCDDDEELDAGLCYDFCKEGFYGVGPVCWESCPEEEPVDGGAICCVDKDTCSDKILDLTTGLPKAIMEGILSGEDPAGITKAVYEALTSILGFVMFKCDA